MVLAMNITPDSHPDASRSQRTATHEVTTGNSLNGRLAVWVATGLGVGMVAPAPGTIGGLWGLPLALALAQIPSLAGQLAILVVLGLLSVAICTRAMQALGGIKDPQSIVLDEISSVPIVFIGISQPGSWIWTEPWIWLVGYVLLRIFDISKPFPCKQLERLPAGWGIMADDWMAAIYAAATLLAILWLMS
jgi:phosphatidylglycerophosphatase A